MFGQKMLIITIIYVTLLIMIVQSQRSPYAGSRPTGYKDRLRPKPNNNDNPNEIINRFGGTNGNNNNRLPYDAHGDADIVNIYNRHPVDHRPFWLINYEAIEAHRNQSNNQKIGTNTIAQRSSFLG